MAGNKWNTIDLRDNRYNQIVHMVSAANGAEDFYSTEVSDVYLKFRARKSRFNCLLGSCMSFRGRCFGTGT